MIGIEKGSQFNTARAKSFERLLGRLSIAEFALTPEALRGFRRCLESLYMDLVYIDYTGVASREKLLVDPEGKQQADEIISKHEDMNSATGIINAQASEGFPNSGISDDFMFRDEYKIGKITWAIPDRNYYDEAAREFDHD